MTVSMISDKIYGYDEHKIMMAKSGGKCAPTFSRLTETSPTESAPQSLGLLDIVTNLHTHCLVNMMCLIRIVYR